MESERPRLISTPDGFMVPEKPAKCEACGKVITDPRPLSLCDKCRAEAMS